MNSGGRGSCRACSAGASPHCCEHLGNVENLGISARKRFMPAEIVPLRRFKLDEKVPKSMTQVLCDKDLRQPKMFTAVGRGSCRAGSAGASPSRQCTHDAALKSARR